jgi:glycosyltransferase involved in cell wall biosynthesis
MKTPLVTIGVPTYNRANHFLRNVVENALGQTYENLEVLVSDNCSTDHTPEVVGSFRDSRVRYVRQERNLGQIGNSNFLVQEARGDYLLVLHDDDRIDPDFIETCVAAAAGHPQVGLIVTGSRIINNDNKVIATKHNETAGLPADEFIFRYYQRRLHLFLCCCLFGTSTLRNVGGFGLDYAQLHDVAAEFLCAAKGHRIDVPDLKADFREHEESETSAARLDAWCRSSLVLLDLACSLVGPRSDELRRIGLETCTNRNYRLALRAPTPWQRVRGMWTVLRHFGWRHFPQRKHLNQMLSGRR